MHRAHSTHETPNCLHLASVHRLSRCRLALSDWFGERPSGYAYSPSSLVTAWAKADDKTKATTLRPVLLAQAGAWSADLSAMAKDLPRNDRMRLEDVARVLASAAKDKTKADDAIRALARIQ